MTITGADSFLSPQELIRLIKNRFVRPDGLMARRWPITSRTIFDNFDDVVPFFLHYGEQEFLLQQVALLQKYNLGFLDVCSEGGHIHSSHVDEWFRGLWHIHRTTGDKTSLQLLRKSVEFVSQNMFAPSGALYSAWNLAQKKPIGTEEPWSAGILEAAVAMRHEFPEFFLQAQGAMRLMAEREWFKRNGLFPYRTFLSPVRGAWSQGLSAIGVRGKSFTVVPPQWGCGGSARETLALHWRWFTTPGNYAQMMKSNSTPAFSLLEFYRATGDESWLAHLDRWIQGVDRWFLDRESGKVWSEVWPDSSRHGVSATSSAFIFVDFICDYFMFTKRGAELLPRAEKILDQLWSRRNADGLIPVDESSGLCHLDNQIDVSISFRRVGEILGRKDLMDRSEDLIRSALRRHGTPDGFLSFSGKVPEKAARHIDPKYNCLVLKGMIHLDTLGKEKIYPDLQEIFQDR